MDSVELTWRRRYRIDIDIAAVEANEGWGIVLYCSEGDIDDGELCRGATSQSRGV